jgi:hypothetical protein
MGFLDTSKMEGGLRMTMIRAVKYYREREERGPRTSSTLLALEWMPRAETHSLRCWRRRGCAIALRGLGEVRKRSWCEEWESERKAGRAYNWETAG